MLETMKKPLEEQVQLLVERLSEEKDPQNVKTLSEAIAILLMVTRL